MVEYHSLNANIIEIILSEEAGKFFILVHAEDGKVYQVKLNAPNQKNNINEYISHHIATVVDAPVLDAKFLYLDNVEIEKLNNKLLELSLSADIHINHKNYFFGIEWKQNITSVKREKDLVKRINEASNRDKFYSLYPLDQYLKNYDRHIGNHLIVKTGNSVQYYLIDFDRIFASTNWGMMFSLFKNFDCLALKDYHHFLSSLIDNSNYDYVLKYANSFSSIEDAEITSIIENIKYIYHINDVELKLLNEWLSHRRDNMFDSCYDNIKCFKRVSQQRFKDVYRQ